MIKLENLIWDKYNISHVARHDVSKDEIKEACLSDHVTLQTHSGRILLIGTTSAGRVLSVILAGKGEGIYYPVTARNASRKERRYYQQIKGGEKVT